MAQRARVRGHWEGWSSPHPFLMLFFPPSLPTFLSPSTLGIPCRHPPPSLSSSSSCLLPLHPSPLLVFCRSSGPIVWTASSTPSFSSGSPLKPSSMVSSSQRLWALGGLTGRGGRTVKHTYFVLISSLFSRPVMNCKHVCAQRRATHTNKRIYVCTSSRVHTVSCLNAFFINTPLSRRLSSLEDFYPQRQIFVFFARAIKLTLNLLCSRMRSVVCAHWDAGFLWARAERIGIFELVGLGWTELRTTQAWACSPNKGTKPHHSDWQAVSKASVHTRHVTSRK